MCWQEMQIREPATTSPHSNSWLIRSVNWGVLGKEAAGVVGEGVGG